MKTHLSMYAPEVAKLFLEYGIITFHVKKPLTRNHGRLTPIDFNFKKLLEDTSGRGRFKELIIKFIDDLKPSWNNIIAIRQSGMYPGTIISDNLILPLLAKKESLNTSSNDLIVVDVVSNGKTIKSVNSNVFTCFSYNFFQKESLYVLCDFETVIKTALEINFINEQEATSLLSWQNNPKSWVENHLSMKLL